ncbi:MAG: copper homeostasis protein CutC [Bacteroidales bacterium]|nr:copper homeostasis protein CutC [Bacteroidales bacterium]MCF8456712.1 copper homeostasis protein CutC [Bacteroidales bacterium]
MKNLLIEVCANSVESAIAAEKGGAKRVELCENLWEGGTTPSHASIEIARESISIDLNVLIRPRGGDFLYSELEYEIICRDIFHAKRLGADGVVVGVLNPDGSIDIPRMEEIIDIAQPMSVTFHRAFDVLKDPFLSLEDLIFLGVDRILTSGQKNTAPEAIDLISELVKKANNRIIIMPGSGINLDNISELVMKTGASEFHSSCRSLRASQMQHRNPDVHISGLPGILEQDYKTTDPEIVRAMLQKAEMALLQARN